MESTREQVKALHQRYPYLSGAAIARLVTPEITRQRVSQILASEGLTPKDESQLEPVCAND